MVQTVNAGGFWPLIFAILPVVHSLPSSAVSNSAPDANDAFPSYTPPSHSTSATSALYYSNSSTTISSSSSSSSSSSLSSSSSVSSTSTGSIPIFTPSNLDQTYRAAAICTSQALDYYAAHNTSVATNFAAIGDHTMIVAAGSTLTSIITGMDSYTNSLGAMTHPTFTFTIAGPTTTVWNDPAAYPTMDPFAECCGYCRMPVFRPVIKYWPNLEKPPNTACLAGCPVLGGTTMGDNSTSQTSYVPSQYASITWEAPSYTSSSTDQANATPTSLPPSAVGGNNFAKQPPVSPTSPSTTSTTSTLFIPPQYSGIITARAEMSAAPVHQKKDDTGSVVYYDVDPEDGFTYTSPYIYVMLKSVAANNLCPGVKVGGTYTSLRYSYLPGELSTIQFRYGTSAAFNFDDLPCPPDSIRYANGWNDGSCNYEPFLAPMTQILKLDPAFQECWIPGCNLWDPPHTLTPQSSMIVTTTGQVASPTPPSPQPVVSSPAAAETPHFSPQPIMASDSPTQHSIDVPSAGFDPSATASPKGPQSGQNTQNPPPSQQSSQPSPAAPQQPTPVAVGSNTLIFHTSEVVVGSQTVRPGSAVTMSGTVISLAPSASAVVIGSSTIAIAAPAPAPAPTTFTLSNVAFVSSSSALVVGTQTLSPGGSAVTVSGTVLSLLPTGSSGGPSLVIGSATVALPTANPTATATAITVTAAGATYTFSPSGSALVIGSQTLVPGGPAITQDGTTISLPSGGAEIVVGSSTIPLAQTTENIGGAVYTAWVGTNGAPVATASVATDGTLIMTGDSSRKTASRLIACIGLILGFWILA